MKKNVFLGVLLIILGILAFLNIQQNNFKNQTKEITNNQTDHSSHYQASAFSPKELDEEIKKNPDKYAIIDVRTKLEYEKGHLPGAIHADYYDTDALKKAAGDKIPVAYCAFSAMRGAYAAYQLYQAGFENVKVLDGGISAWAEDIQGMDSSDPKVKSVFNHPKNIFPSREPGEYPEGQGEVEINLIAKKYDFSPRVLEVKHGQKVTLNMISLDVTHGFSLPEFGIETELLPTSL